MLVMPSGLPVSLIRATPGAAGRAVSRVKLNWVTALTLPATSVCRTCTALAPSWAVKLADQVVPPSVEYSTRAPGSALPGAGALLLVGPSGLRAARGGGAR